MSKNRVAISVENVSKSFKLPHEKQGSIKSIFINFFKGKSRTTYEKQEVLKDISFEIYEGEFFGIVGKNGSGKSTLLKLISQIYSPNKGAILVNGKLTPFIELGVGFSPELTGRENVYLNGALLGFSRTEIEAMYDQIVAFAEIEKFMDQKLKNYSSGMQVRLAFSIAIQAKSEILLLDEVLAVGDASFQKKCYDYFAELKKERRTVILVTHDMGNVEKFCTRALLLDKGKIKSIGNPRKVAKQYALDNIHNTGNTRRNADNLTYPLTKLILSEQPDKTLSSKQDLIFDIIYKIEEDMPIQLGISILKDNFSVIEHNTKELTLNHKIGLDHILRYHYPLKGLNSGQYSVAVAAFKKENLELIGYNTKSYTFIIDNNEKLKTAGLLTEKGKWIQHD